MGDREIERPKIWLVWSMRGTRPSLRSVCLTRELAERHEEAVKGEFGYEFSWIEENSANHLCGHRDILAGDEYLGLRMRQVGMSKIGRWRNGVFFDGDGDPADTRQHGLPGRHPRFARDKAG